MKLLLDEHFSPIVAVALRERGYDVLAVGETQGLRSLSDSNLLLWARGEDRVILTEDVEDFTSQHNVFIARGDAHVGILFTSPRAFSRDKDATGRLIRALVEFLESRADRELYPGGITWL